ncbi:Methionyl-tRNA formyltransferase [[Clostridium] cellulosi]|jgi:methionyl-tRNA formyltransferase (EC 2.1.2.9)|uniref:Methionyl-tRNA formyltransferase n=1 Tax=[Clostridium] cellulosi TaxID=29343 RepID=A0A078KPH1_9FIRM|nr:Methionyl-tRNA formyltransferase [[Clostridium] cellulosi]
MRIIFMGTPEFAVASLDRIVKDGHEVAAVFTQPDRPKGRGYHLTPPPVKVMAQNYGIPVYQPTTLKDEETIQIIKDINPDCIVVVAYGRILPESVLNIPRLGCINVHASLLPKLRGAAPIQWSIINGETETGITTMFMAKGLDTGDMILKAKCDIGPDETFGELHDKLMVMGAETLSKTLTLLEQGKAPREKQDDSLATYAPMIDKNSTLIDWNKSAQEIHNLVRGLNPSPSAYTLFNGLKFKIISSKLHNTESDKTPGSVVSVSEEGFVIACGDGKTLLVKEVQAQGGKKMTAAAYANGHGVNDTTIFGQ